MRAVGRVTESVLANAKRAGFSGLAGRGRNAGVDMLRRGAVRSVLDRLRSQPRGWNPGPAMPPPPPPSAAAANSACLCSVGQSVAQGRKQPGFVDLGAERRFAPAGALSLKGCLGWQDGEDGGFRRRLDGDALGIKARVLTTPRQLLRDSEVLPLEEVGGKSLSGACRRGKPLVGFPEQPGAAKMVVAVDVDEVLGSFLAALNKFIADRYSWNHSVSEYHVYEFFRIWNCSRERADFLVHEFFTTHYFQDDLGRMLLKITH